jgi:hypothetical protein
VGKKGEDGGTTITPRKAAVQYIDRQSVSTEVQFDENLLTARDDSLQAR